MIVSEAELQYVPIQQTRSKCGAFQDVKRAEQAGYVKRHICVCGLNRGCADSVEAALNERRQGLRPPAFEGVGPLYGCEAILGRLPEGEYGGNVAAIGGNRIEPADNGIEGLMSVRGGRS